MDLYGVLEVARQQRTNPDPSVEFWEGTAHTPLTDWSQTRNVWETSPQRQHSWDGPKDSSISPSRQRNAMPNPLPRNDPSYQDTSSSSDSGDDILFSGAKKGRKNKKASGNPTKPWGLSPVRGSTASGVFGGGRDPDGHYVATHPNLIGAVDPSRRTLLEEALGAFRADKQDDFRERLGAAPQVRALSDHVASQSQKRSEEEAELELEMAVQAAINRSKKAAAEAEELNNLINTASHSPDGANKAPKSHGSTAIEIQTEISGDDYSEMQEQSKRLMGSPGSPLARRSSLRVGPGGLQLAASPQRSGSETSVPSLLLKDPSTEISSPAASAGGGATMGLLPPFELLPDFPDLSAMGRFAGHLQRLHRLYAQHEPARCRRIAEELLARPGVETAFVDAEAHRLTGSINAEHKPLSVPAARLLVRVERFYAKHCAPRRRLVPFIAYAFEGREVELFGTLVARYGPEPPAKQEEKPPAPNNLAHPTPRPHSNSLDYGAPSPLSRSATPRLSLEPRDLEERAKARAEDPALRLRRFYRQFAPQKINQVPRVLEAFAGREEALFDELIEKYGEEPTVNRTAEAAQLQSTCTPAEYAQRLRRFYRRYAPERMSKLQWFLDSYVGDEELLFFQLTNKYGPEPSAGAGYDTPAPTPVFDENGSPVSMRGSMLGAASPVGGDRDRNTPTRSLTTGGNRATNELPPPAPSVTDAYSEGAGSSDDDATSVNRSTSAAVSSVTTASAAAPQQGSKNFNPAAALGGGYSVSNMSDMSESHAETSAQSKSVTPQQAPLSTNASSSAVTEPKVSSSVKEAHPEFYQRLSRYYQKHMPDKVPSVPKFIEKYASHEEKLMKTLVQRYGEEPSDEEIAELDAALEARDDLDGEPPSPATSGVPSRRGSLATSEASSLAPSISGSPSFASPTNASSPTAPGKRPPVKKMPMKSTAPTPAQPKGQGPAPPLKMPPGKGKSSPGPGAAKGAPGKVASPTKGAPSPTKGAPSPTKGAPSPTGKKAASPPTKGAPLPLKKMPGSPPSKGAPMPNAGGPKKAPMPTGMKKMKAAPGKGLKGAPTPGSPKKMPLPLKKPPGPPPSQ